MKQRKHKRRLYGRIQSDAIDYYKNYDWEAFKKVVMDRSKHTKLSWIILDAEFADSQPEHKKWQSLAAESLKIHRRQMFRKRRPRLNMAYGGQFSMTSIPNPFPDPRSRSNRDLVTVGEITDFDPKPFIVKERHFMRRVAPAALKGEHSHPDVTEVKIGNGDREFYAVDPGSDKCIGMRGFIDENGHLHQTSFNLVNPGK
jgi:hypothetical protein